MIKADIYKKLIHAGLKFPFRFSSVRVRVSNELGERYARKVTLPEINRLLEEDTDEDQVYDDGWDIMELEDKSIEDKNFRNWKRNQGFKGLPVREQDEIEEQDREKAEQEKNWKKKNDYSQGEFEHEMKAYLESGNYPNPDTPSILPEKFVKYYAQGKDILNAIEERDPALVSRAENQRIGIIELDTLLGKAFGPDRVEIPYTQKYAFLEAYSQKHKAIVYEEEKYLYDEEGRMELGFSEWEGVRRAHEAYPEEPLVYALVENLS